MFSRVSRVVLATAILALSAIPSTALDTKVLVQSEPLTGGAGCIGAFCNNLHGEFVEEVSGITGIPHTFAEASGEVGEPGVISSFQGQASAASGSGGIVNRTFVSNNVDEQIAEGSLSTSAEGGGSESGSGILEALAAVPVPASFPLLLGALGLGVMVSRRRKG